MKKRIIFLTAVVFLSSVSIAHTNAMPENTGIPFGDGFPGGHYYTLNIIIRHGQGAVSVLGLPQDAKAYAVYADAAGRPGEYGEAAVVLVPDLLYVDDEYGNNLIFLGVIDLQDTDSTGQSKSPEIVVDLTPVFEWTGDVCYVQPESDANCEGECLTIDLCCVDADMDFNFQRCDLMTDVGEISDGFAIQCPVYDIDEIQYVPLSAQCNSYENERLFNIGELNGYLWESDAAGSRSIQVRLYPIEE
ncbi:MAG: hypothetical protein AB1499_06905 [Nitrospirota bacterium]